MMDIELGQFAIVAKPDDVWFGQLVMIAFIGKKRKNQQVVDCEDPRGVQHGYLTSELVIEPWPSGWDKR